MSPRQSLLARFYLVTRWWKQRQFLSIKLVLGRTRARPMSPAYSRRESCFLLSIEGRYSDGGLNGNVGSGDTRRVTGRARAIAPGSPAGSSSLSGSTTLRVLCRLERVSDPVPAVPASSSAEQESGQAAAARGALRRSGKSTRPCRSPCSAAVIPAHVTPNHRVEIGHV